MNKLIVKLTLLLGMIAAGSCCALYAEVIDKIEIVVNDEIITQGEIDRVLAPVYEQYKMRYSEDELVEKLVAARQKIVQQLIEERLILSEARKLNIEVDEREVEAKLNDSMQRFGSRKKFERALLEQRLTFKEIKTRYRDQLIAKRLVDQKIGSRIAVTPVEISSFYEKHISEFTRPVTITARHILIKPKEDRTAKAALELAREIMTKVRGGSDFAEMARTYSEGPNAENGGLMPDIKQGDLLPELEKAVFALNAGEVSGIIQTNIGYHIFKVEEKSEPKKLELSEVRKQIEEILFMEKAREEMRDWLNDLKEKAYIGFK